MADQIIDILKLDDALDVGDAEGTLDIEEEKDIEALPPETTDVELSPGGILDEETITRGLSNLGCSANGCHKVFLNVTIPGFSLTDISLLSEYQHLQKVEIPYNDITDLYPLGKLRYLLFLDASHNKIEKLLDFVPPINLLEVDMSWNNVRQMCDLSAHQFLKKLVLDNNSISRILGLENCKNLKYLSLSHNNISKVTGLDGLAIQHLDLSNNNIKFLKNIESLARLKTINLSRNCIRSLSGLSCNTQLESVELEDNEVLDVSEIQHLKQAKFLRQLNLLRNPIQELPDYRLSILFRINQLTVLDRHPVKEEEKVRAVNMFKPPVEVIAARDHIMHVVYSFLQPSRVRDCTLPNIGTPYPMLVLVGPKGSGRKELIANLLHEFVDYFGYGIIHTTRRPWLDEVANKDYYFVSLESFEADIKRGEFIETYEYQNNWYGLKMSSVENVAKEGLACVTNMTLEGVLSLKRTFFMPRYVLILPLDNQAHEKRLQERNFYSQEDIDDALKQAEVYIKQNQNHPGFFDMLINSDDPTEAYSQLRRLVMDYLGISSAEAANNICTSITVGDRETADLHTTCARKAVSTVLRSGSWSRPSVTESEIRPRSSRVASVVQGHGIVEKESIKRRHSTVKQLVSGHIPTLTEQISLIYPSATAQGADNHTGLREPVNARQYSAPTKQSGLETGHGRAELPISDDSSSDELTASNMSEINSDLGAHRDKGRKVNKNANFMGDLPTEKVNPLDLLDEHSYQTTSKINPLSASHPDSRYAVARHGSGRHAVLPPIQNISA